MKSIKYIGVAILTAALLFVPSFARAQSTSGDWNDGFGQGNRNDDWLISGSGIPLAVIPSVQSNTVYYITSADASGAAKLETVWFKQDSIAGTLGWFVATNTWTCASNQPAGTNIIWLSSTNSGMATNDLLVLENEIQDSYQLLVLGGGSTTSTGEVITNSAGYVGIKVWNTPTNAITAGDKIHKMRQVATWTPLAQSGITNQISSNIVDHFGQWLRLGDLRGQNISLRQPRVGMPCAVVMTVSNTGSLYIQGEYFVRPRR